MFDHQLYIQRCLELAQMGRGTAAPNPMVGAVLVHNDRIIGEGYHQTYGAAHAEVNCLNSVTTEDRHLIPDSTMYVSLEPCAHYGKTPPCANRLVAERVKQVVICNTDPFAQVSGKGIQILQEAGIQNITGVAEEKGLWLNRRFFCFHQQKRPYIILKWAQTQQGFFAPGDRSRLQMSNRHSQQLVHKWRTEEAAILVGTETARMDDPQLNARLWQGKQPLRIVIDRKLELTSSLRLFTDEAPTWVVNEIREATEDPLSYVQLASGPMLLPALLQRLHEHNQLSLIVEGGARLLQSFIEQGLWDEARVFETPNLLSEGIAAPVLRTAHHLFTTDMDTDRLHVYLNTETAYPYAEGMEL